MKIKMDTFQIFLTILFILVLSIIIINFFNTTQDIKKETFVNYANTDSNLYNIIIPQYSSKNVVTAITANIYFDESNGNVIIVNNLFNNLQNDDQFIIIDRNGNYNLFNSTPSTNSNVPIMPTTITSSYKSWIFPNNMNNVPKEFMLHYQIIYIPSGNDTYMQLIQTYENVSVFNVCHFFGYGGTRELYMNGNCNNNFDNLNYANNVIDNNPKNNDYQSDDFYDPNKLGKVYQMTNFVNFDGHSGNLIVKQFISGNLREIVYNRLNGNMPGNNNTYNMSQQILNLDIRIPKNNSLNSWSVLDSEGNNVVTYIGIANDTVICISQKDPNDTNNVCFRLVDVKRFDAFGEVIDGTNQNKNPDKNCSNTGSGDYWKGYWNAYYQNMPTTSPPQNKSNDYILKTQIVPPVYPYFPFYDYESDSDEEEDPTSCDPITSAPTTSAPTTSNNFIKDVDIPATPGVGNIPSEIPIFTNGSSVNGSSINDSYVQSNNSSMQTNTTEYNYPFGPQAINSNNSSNKFIPVTNDFSRFSR
jgi:hypothetical protein